MEASQSSGRQVAKQFVLPAQSSGGQVAVEVVMTCGPGKGLRGHVEEEVVHLSLQLVSGEPGLIHSDDPCEPGLIHSDDPCEPHCFHNSRRVGLELARARQTEINALGFGGPAVALKIPGIPFPQEKDCGLHASLYNQPQQEGANYIPPDMEKCKSLVGKRFTICLDGAIKVLNGSEQNDMKVGGCYYVSLSCGPHAKTVANQIKSQVGLSYDDTQEFHLSLATIAPSWLQCHPKSSHFQQKCQDQAEKWQQAFRVFRHGDSVGFSGFNDDATTGWTTHWRRVQAACKMNADLKEQIKTLGHNDAQRIELQRQIIDVKTFGFCQTVGSKEKIKTINQPDVVCQGNIAKQMATDIASLPN